MAASSTGCLKIISSHTVEKSFFLARCVTLGSSEIRFIVIIVRCGPVVQLVRYAGHKGAVVVDLLVEFGALVTHSSFRIGANGSPDWLLLIRCSNGGIVHKSPRPIARNRTRPPT